MNDLKIHHSQDLMLLIFCLKKLIIDHNIFYVKVNQQSFILCIIYRSSILVHMLFKKYINICRYSNLSVQHSFNHKIDRYQSIKQYDYYRHHLFYQILYDIQQILLPSIICFIYYSKRVCYHEASCWIMVRYKSRDIKNHLYNNYKNCLVKCL